MEEAKKDVKNTTKEKGKKITKEWYKIITKKKKIYFFFLIFLFGFSRKSELIEEWSFVSISIGSVNEEWKGETSWIYVWITQAYIYIYIYMFSNQHICCQSVHLCISCYHSIALSARRSMSIVQEKG